MSVIRATCRFSIPSLALILLAGCSSTRPCPDFADAHPATAGAPRNSTIPSDPPLAVYGQYADPSISSYPLYEVYLTNTGATPRVFTAVSLDGRTLIRPPAAILETPSFSLDGLRYSLPSANSDPDIVWWQFYPTDEVSPGASVVLRLCFRGDVRKAHSLTVSDASGKGESLLIPRRSTLSVPLIKAVTYASDLSRLYVQCDSSKNPPAALWVCGKPADLRILNASDVQHPFLAEASAPIQLKGGQPVDLRIRFADGRERRAYLRVLAGISVYDAPSSEASGEKPSPASAGVQLIPVDGACSDLRSRKPGDAAWSVIRERDRYLKTSPDMPAGFGFCTGLLPETAAIYGRISDAVFAKPYRHGWGRNPNRFLDEEAVAIASQRASCEPFPFLYIPERYTRRGRSLSPTEVETLEWTALASGAKGIRRHFAYNADRPEPQLTAVLLATSDAVGRLQSILAPLIPVSDETQGAEKAGYVRIHTAWSGSQGALFLVRDRSVGSFPGEVPARKDVHVELNIPSWCKGKQVFDLLSGKSLAEARPGRSGVVIPELKAFRVLWVDADPGQSALRMLVQKDGK